MFFLRKHWVSTKCFSNVFSQDTHYVFLVDKHIRNPITCILKGFSFGKTYGCQECLPVLPHLASWESAILPAEWQDPRKKHPAMVTTCESVRTQNRARNSPSLC